MIYAFEGFRAHFHGAAEPEEPCKVAHAVIADCANADLMPGLSIALEGVRRRDTRTTLP